MTTPIHLPTSAEREVVPGHFARFVHSDRMTVAHWRIEKGSSIPEHDHVHEQVVNCLDGSYELTVAGVAHILSAGDVVVLPSGVRHGGRAISACHLLDVFHPVREDYRG